MLINKKENFEVIEDGNILQCRDGFLYLSLCRKEVRNIGRLCEHTKTKRTWYVKSGLKEKIHVFRKNDSWGLMYCVLEILPVDAMLKIVSDKGTYKIKLSEAKEKGSFLWFKTQGFERQFFVPKEYWKLI